MKALKKWLKTIAMFFTSLILFQSCATYKNSVTLSQAAQEEKAVKIITVNDDAYKYKYIIYEDGQFYGVKDNPGKDIKFSINAEEVAEVLMKEGEFPRWAWIAIGTVVFIGLILILVVKPNMNINTGFGG